MVKQCKGTAVCMSREGMLRTGGKVGVIFAQQASIRPKHAVFWSTILLLQRLPKRHHQRPFHGSCLALRPHGIRESTVNAYTFVPGTCQAS